MNWKTRLRLSDLAPDTRLEVACITCGHIRVIEAREWQVRARALHLHLDEIERRAACRMRGCAGRVRLNQLRDDNGGFVGGIA